MDPTPTSDGRLMACVAYGSMITGLPLWIIPFLQKNDAFALRHAKHAAVIYIGSILFTIFYSVVVWVGMFALTMVTLGFGGFLSCCCLPFYLAPLVPAIHGVILATSDRSDPPFLTFGLGDSLFSSIQVEGPR